MKIQTFKNNLIDNIDTLLITNKVSYKEYNSIIDSIIKCSTIEQLQKIELEVMI